MGTYAPAAPECIHTRSPRYPVDRVVIHTAQGTLKGTVAWFQTQGRKVPTASHYVIGEDGEIVQMVADEKKCWHAGSKQDPGMNDRSIGIEHAGWVDDGKPPTEAMLKASAKVTAVMCRKFGIPVDRQHIIGHCEVKGATHTDPGAEWPWERYMALVKLAMEGP